MKFYVNQETYDKLSKKIEDLNNLIFKAEDNPKSGNIYQIEYWETKIMVYKEILENTVVLPTEDNWNFRFISDCGIETETFVMPSITSAYLNDKCPNGILIKNK